LEHTTIADIAHEVMAQVPQAAIAKGGVRLPGVLRRRSPLGS
jgi:hypothetical protein